MKRFLTISFFVTLAACGTVSMNDPAYALKVNDHNVVDTGRVSMQVAQAAATIDLGIGRRKQYEASAEMTRAYAGMYGNYMLAVNNAQFRDPRVTELLKTLEAVRGKRASAPAAPEPTAAPAVSAAPTTAPQPIQTTPVPEKGKKGKRGKAVVVSPPASVPATPAVSAVGTDLPSGIAAAKNFAELKAVFEREAVANPSKAGEFRGVTRMLTIESANLDPSRFKKVQADLAAAYGQ